ncbi:MAG: hypothetical protein ACRYG7_43840 [Janthinobacterium lividum]
MLCDTGGRIWRVVVQAASGHDSRGAQPILPARQQVHPAWASRLRIVLTDSAYHGRFAQQVRAGLAAPGG